MTECRYRLTKICIDVEPISASIISNESRSSRTESVDLDKPVPTISTIDDESLYSPVSIRIEDDEEDERALYSLNESLMESQRQNSRRKRFSVEIIKDKTVTPIIASHRILKDLTCNSCHCIGTGRRHRMAVNTFIIIAPTRPFGTLKILRNILKR
jgi:hypothetical protein